MDGKYAKGVYLAVLFGVGVFLFSQLRTVFSFLSGAVTVFYPVLLGLLLALLLRIPLSFFERLWDRCPWGERRKGRRAVCLGLTLLLAVGAVAGFLSLILPRLFEALLELLDALPEAIDGLRSLAEKWGFPLPLEKPSGESWEETLRGLAERYGDRMAAVVLRLLSDAVGGVLELATAVIVAVYVLAQKERLQSEGLRFLRAVLSVSAAERVLRVGGRIGKTLSRFFAGQALEAVILGGLCFLGMSVMRMPLALPISVIVGAAAIIPVFGALAGGVIGGLLLLSVSPRTALGFLIFLVILQQVEDGLIYPRVMGRSVGLPGVWVLVSVIVGSSFGILGVLLSVPTASVLYALLRDFVRERERKAFGE